MIAFGYIRCMQLGLVPRLAVVIVKLVFRNTARAHMTLSLGNNPTSPP